MHNLRLHFLLMSSVLQRRSRHDLSCYLWQKAVKVRLQTLGTFKIIDLVYALFVMTLYFLL